MKLVVIGLLIASAWIAVNAPQARPAEQGKGNAGESANHTQQYQGKSAASPSPVSADSTDRNKNQTGSPQANNGKGSESVTPAKPVTIGTDNNPLTVSTVKDGWDKALVIGTIGLVIVGGFGIWYAIRTLRAIERQADLQEANLGQWVDLKPLGLIVETTSKTDPPKEVTLNLRWRILNNTSLPFTLQKVETKVAIGLDWEHFEAAEEDTIAPAKSSNNYFDYMVPFKLTKSQTKAFLDSGVALSITQRVTYIDASGYEQEQYFGDWYDCTFPDKMEINHPLGKTATWIRTEEGDDKPDIVRSRSKFLIKDADSISKPPEIAN